MVGPREPDAVLTTTDNSSLALRRFTIRPEEDEPVGRERRVRWGVAEGLGTRTWASRDLLCVTSRHVWVKDLDQHAGGPMRTPPWTDEHSRLISRSAPTVEAPTDAEVDRVWTSVSALIAVSGTVRRSRSRWRTGVGAGVAALVLGTSGIAAAGVWKARTGEFNTDPESIRLGGPGELIDPRGNDYEEVLREEISDIPFPSSGKGAARSTPAAHE